MLWSDFLDTADRLVQGKTEADWRSAVSRAYYAVFHYFSEFLLAHGLDVGQGGQAHFNLYIGLNNCGFGGIAAIARLIDDLRNNRVFADYNLRRSLQQAVAIVQVNRARALVADFQAQLSAIPGSQIADGARRHLQAIGRLPRTP